METSFIPFFAIIAVLIIAFLFASLPQVNHKTRYRVLYAIAIIMLLAVIPISEYMAGGIQNSSNNYLLVLIFDIAVGYFCMYIAALLKFNVLKRKNQALENALTEKQQENVAILLEGLCWSDINTMFLKCRKKEKSIHDVKSMSIFGVSNLLSEDYIITMINSTLISHYVDNFVNNTQTFQINDARQLPIIIPTSTDDEQAKSFVSNAIKIKKGHTTNNALDVIQKEVDSYVEKIYNL